MVSPIKANPTKYATAPTTSNKALIWTRVREVFLVATDQINILMMLVKTELQDHNKPLLTPTST
jgi:hypothetical protein